MRFFSAVHVGTLGAVGGCRSGQVPSVAAVGGED